MDKKTPDAIDIELSKTYFRKGLEDKPPEPEKNTEEKPASVIKKQRNIFPLAAAFIFIALLVFTSIYFLNKKEITTKNITSPATAKPKKPISIMDLTRRTVKPSSSIDKIDYATPPTLPEQNGTTLYDFETGVDGWDIPGWAIVKPDHVGRSIKRNFDHHSKGKGSLEVYVEFPGDQWTAAIVEIQHFLDLDDYNMISADIYLPAECPKPLKGKLIFTIGENWQFTEMSRNIKLQPGQWNTIIADLSEASIDWRRTKVNKAFKEDIRKIAIRIESTRTAYSGPIFIDNVTVYEKSVPKPDSSVDL